MMTFAPLKVTVMTTAFQCPKCGERHAVCIGLANESEKYVFVRPCDKKVIKLRDSVLGWVPDE